MNLLKNKIKNSKFFKIKSSKISKNKKAKKSKKSSSSKFLKFLKKEDTYSNKDICVVSFSSLVFGFVLCLFIFMLITGGANIVTLCFELKDFIKSYTALTSSYYKDVDKNTLVDAAINGMYSSLDDEFTTYINPQDSEDFSQTVEGEYEGIGCTVLTDQDGNIIVFNIFENSPAAKAGLKVGDIVVSIDGEDYSEKTSSDMADYIKNSSKSKFVLTIIRDEEKKDLTVTRKKVEIPTVTSTTYTMNSQIIGYLKISSFSNVTYKQFKENLTELEKNNITGLIIDVRNNGGGYLNSVTDISSLFLPKGKVIYQLETEKGITKIKDTTKTKKTYPIAVLVNKNSASASEILTSVIKESYGGTIIGTNTFGKGTVQETMNMKDGSIIKYTTKKWLTPNGNWINEVGVEPTIKLELSDEYYENPTTENDNQLQEALKILTTP